ncbi:MAG: hypothetical protein RR501_12205 [Cloacibacillus sp.]
MVKKQRFIVGMLLFVTLILSRTAACAQDTWYNHADTSWYYGAEHATGTVEDPYVITTAEQLAGLAKICNDNINNSKTYKIAEFTGKTIVLDSDIDLKNIEWIPIARLTVFHSDGFNGTFDGRGHTIKNLYILYLHYRELYQLHQGKRRRFVFQSQQAGDYKKPAYRRFCNNHAVTGSGSRSWLQHVRNAPKHRH